MNNRIHVLHGVNLDQLGVRDPDHYGSITLLELERQIFSWAKDLGLETTCFQFNHEGDFVEELHRSRGMADGLILNAGAWTHYSWAIRDAAEIPGIPIVEVHLSAVSRRELFRRKSVLKGLTLAKIDGRGPDGYRRALKCLAEELLD